MTAGKASLLKRGALKEVMFEVICFCLCKATMKLFIGDIFSPHFVTASKEGRKTKKNFFSTDLAQQIHHSPVKRRVLNQRTFDFMLFVRSTELLATYQLICRQRLRLSLLFERVFQLKHFRFVDFYCSSKWMKVNRHF